jgi:DNA mismatch repair protein MutS2
MSELHSLDWDLILDKIKNCATSLAGQEKISQTRPLSSAALAEKQFAEIEAAYAVVSSGVRPHAQSLDLFNNWIVRIRKKSVLKTLELKDVRHFCLESIALKETLKNFDSAWAVETRSQMMEAEEPLSAIDQILTPQGDIRNDASETLFRLFSERERLARDVQQTLDRLVKDHKAENMLQDKYVTTRDGRWVVPVRSGMQHFLPGVIHGSSQTKQTVFMEPEKVVPMNNRLRQIEVEIEDEIERILADLSRYLHQLTSQFEKNQELMEMADIRFAQA